ncbi:UNVERIFIED_ORG: hypothetical protein GGD51_000471 [Rhizobium esperanzae]
MPETTRELLTSGGWKELACGPLPRSGDHPLDPSLRGRPAGVALLKYEAGGVIITTKLSFRNGLASSATPR